MNANSQDQMSNRLRIIHILLSKGFAGTERSTVESCNAQCGDHDVLLITRENQAKKSGACIKPHLNPSVQVEEVNPNFFTRKSIQNIIDRWQPQVIHAHLRRPTRLIAKCKTDAVKISTLHIGVNGAQFLDMDALIAISPWQLEHIPNEYSGEVQWIRNSLLPHPALPLNKIGELRNQLGATEKTFVIGGVGRLSNSKGWDVLIEAFKTANLDNALLLLIGEGRDATKLKKLSDNRPNIRFLGFQNNVKDYYAAFDVFVCPSREEPMGRVVLEALDAGVRVIASDIEGPKDMLNEYPGRLFPCEDVSALRAALEETEKNRFDGYQKPDLSLHHLENVSREMIALYRRVICKRPHSNP
ncbi:glycosyltransferase [Teredinibacter haidensis]|uniref:glycosyltransferase n=1 Tax=Teredinibacter haidensis TaxID=2731755 RepID=UPI000948A3FB|nr:glycosyltransferase [Teredinibacter haidensis]